MSLQMFLDKRIDSVRMGKRRHMPRALDLTKVMIRQSSVKTVNNGGCGQVVFVPRTNKVGRSSAAYAERGGKSPSRPKRHSCASLSMLSHTLLWRSDGMLR
jgi:hypothetical protein